MYAYMHAYSIYLHTYIYLIVKISFVVLLTIHFHSTPSYSIIFSYKFYSMPGIDLVTDLILIT